MKLLCGNCLEIMKYIPDNSIDLIITDLPYSSTRNEWDKPVDLELLWKEYNRITKDTTPVILFSAMPFTVDLINSNRKNFRYEIIWRKNIATGFLNANRMPLKAHENLLVFYRKLPVYNPQKFQGIPYIKTMRRGDSTTNYGSHGENQAKSLDGKRYPLDVVEFKVVNTGGGNARKDDRHLHPTQKPLRLLEYLISTYSNKGDMVLDNCFGSCSTGIACLNTKRNFIGIEMNKEYFIKGREWLIDEIRTRQVLHSRTTCEEIDLYNETYSEEISDNTGD